MNEQPGMKRKMAAELLAWAKSPGRKPLILQGARQTGKTWLLRELGRTGFAAAAYLNFEQDPALGDLFAGDLSPARLLSGIGALLRMDVTPDTLIVLDEIQSCRRALTSLKYFCEAAPEYAVAAAGSLLGVAVRPSESSYPVGKVDVKTLLPMDFEEFLWASGEGRAVPLLRESYAEGTPLAGALHERLLSLCRRYLVCGGMPAAARMAAGKDRPDWREIRDAQLRLLSGAVADMARYASPAESVRIQACHRSLPAQLAKPNPKFQYRVVRRGATAARFEYALDWLVQAGLISLCRRVSRPGRPLRPFIEADAFKAYPLDAGLYGAMAGFSPDDILAARRGMAFGGLAETYVNNALRAAHDPVCYWQSENRAEVDFLVESADGRLTAVEVKSGVRVRSRSLDVFRGRYPESRAARLSEKNFGAEGGILSVPLYAAFLLD